MRRIAPVSRPGVAVGSRRVTVFASAVGEAVETSGMTMDVHTVGTSPTKRRVARTILAITLVLIAGACVAAIFFAMRVEPPRKEVSALAPLVESIVVQPENVTERYVGYATANAERRAKLAAELSATVVERINNLRAGVAVVKDQPLIQLDDREYQLTYQRAEALATAEQASLAEIDIEREKLAQLIKAAEAELRVTEAERNRVARLFERDQAAKKEYDFAHLAYQTTRRTLLGYQRELAKLTPRGARAEASIKSYQASAAIAMLNVGRCTIKAPFAGSIESIYVDVGDRVSPGTVVVSVVDTSRIEIPLQLPAASYSDVHVGSPCELLTDSLAHTSWQGVIARVAPVIDVQTRTFAAYVTVENDTQRRPLVPGTFVRAVVKGATLHDRLLVPRGAIRNGRVFVLHDGRAELRQVDTERTIVDQAVVTGALHAGDRVIVSRLDSMIDGLRVRSETHTTAVMQITDHATSPMNVSKP